MTSTSTRPLLVHCQDQGVIVPAEAPAHVTVPPAGAVHIWYAPLDALRDRLTPYTELLDPVELDRMARFRFALDRDRFILGHGLLRSLLGRYLDRDPSLIRLARGPYGKPYLERKSLRFNLSDTKDAVLIAFSTEMELGADIETMTREVDHHAVSNHYFTATEINGIGLAMDPKRRFLELWTRKEAVLKASGVGIMDDLRVLRVDGERNTMLIDHAAFVALAAAQYHVRTWHVGEHHLVSIASPMEPKAVDVFHA